MKKDNWKKIVIYDFIQWLEDTENIDFLNTMNIETDKMENYISDYKTACYYDYEDYKDIEDFTLEEMEEFLREIYL